MNQRLLFVDTNVILRFVLMDDADHSPRAAAFFTELATADFDILISDTVVSEAVFVLQKQYKIDRTRIADAVETILSTDGVQYIGNVNMPDVLRMYADIPRLSFVDCMHAWIAMQLPEATIVTFDEGFDRVPGLVRIEPQLPEGDQ